MVAYIANTLVFILRYEVSEKIKARAPVILQRKSNYMCLFSDRYKYISFVSLVNCSGVIIAEGILTGQKISYQGASSHLMFELFLT